MKKVEVFKMVEKKHLGYRVVTVDQVIIETDNDRSLLVIDDMDKKILIDLTQHTVDSMIEFFKVLKEDMEAQDV